MTGHYKPRWLLLSFVFGLTCLHSSLAFGGDDNKDLRKQLQKKLEVRLGLRDATTDKGIKGAQQPLFVVQKPGLIGLVSGTQSLGDEIASALQGVTNVIVNDSLSRTPNKSDYAFPVGELVRIHSLNVGKDMRSVRFQLRTVQPYGFNSFDGSQRTANPNAYVALEVPGEWLAQQDCRSILNAIFQWVAPQDPSTMPHLEGEDRPVSPAADAASIPGVSAPEPSPMSQTPTESAPTGAPPSQGNQPADSASTAPSVDLKEGQTPEEVEKMLGKPTDTITIKGSVAYIYPTVKVIFENGKLVDVQYQQK